MKLLYTEVTKSPVFIPFNYWHEINGEGWHSDIFRNKMSEDSSFHLHLAVTRLQERSTFAVHRIHDFYYLLNDI